MQTERSRSGVGSTLVDARAIANYARTCGIAHQDVVERPQYNHLGAIFCDAVLQAGVRYHPVVSSRVNRISSEFPNCKTMDGIRNIVESGRVGEFLLWSHPVKLDRFSNLVRFCDAYGVSDVGDLKVAFSESGFRQDILRVSGVGEKTADYIACLAGCDVIPVDRHIRAFGARASVVEKKYEYIKSVFSFAADFLDLRRREFDARVWGFETSMDAKQRTKQLDMLADGCLQ